MSRALPATTSGGAHARSDRAESSADRIREFRRRLGGSAAAVAVLGAINIVTTPFFPWFVFPAVVMAVPLASKLGSLWADGVSLTEIFSRTPPRRPAPRSALLAPGSTATRAEAAAEHARADISAILADMSETDRGLIPEVMPTVDRLVERIRLLATTLAGLDSAIGPGALPQLDQRISEAQKSGSGEKTITLLRRQRDSMADLLERRTTLRAQLESAQLALEQLRLQIVKLRSAGVQAAIDNVASATQEARALARDLGHVMDAAAELRALDRRDSRPD